MGFAGPSLSLFIFLATILGGWYNAATSPHPPEPELSLRALVLGHWTLMILFEAFFFMLVPNLWLGITGFFIWRKPKTVLRTVLLICVPLLWLCYTFLVAFPELPYNYGR